jgi:hypothetical protein
VRTRGVTVTRARVRPPLWVVASAAVVAAVAFVLLARSNGYLGGRDHHGPLSPAATLGITVSALAAPGAEVVFGGGVVFSDDGSAPIVIESARVNQATPGLRARIAYYADRQQIGTARGPLPAGSGTIAGGHLSPGPPGTTRGDILVGAAAPRPGVYRFDGIRLRYRRGRRSFEQIVGTKTILCVNRERRCPANAR